MPFNLTEPIQQFRGPKAALATLPSTGKQGLLAWTTDTHELYVDSGSGRGIGPGNAWLRVSSAFDAIASGTNLTADMIVGTGAALEASGSGVIDATEINGIPITGTLTHPGQIPISQPGNASAIWSDPLVQGTQAAGTSANTVNPVLVAGVGPDTNIHNISTDNSGNLNVKIADGPQVNIQDSTGEALLSTDSALNVHIKTQEVFNTDGFGNVGVNVQGTVPVSGTITEIPPYKLGQQAMAASVPVAIASDQSTIPVSLATAPTTPITASSLPQPANAAQEAGGNLATLVIQTRNDAQVIDVLNEILGQLRLLNINLASSMPSAHVDTDSILLDALNN